MSALVFSFGARRMPNMEVHYRLYALLHAFTRKKPKPNIHRKCWYIMSLRSVIKYSTTYSP